MPVLQSIYEIIDEKESVQFLQSLIQGIQNWPINQMKVWKLISLSNQSVILWPLP
jgi:hypothetical protein